MEYFKILNEFGLNIVLGIAGTGGLIVAATNHLDLKIWTIHNLKYRWERVTIGILGVCFLFLAFFVRPNSTIPGTITSYGGSIRNSDLSPKGWLLCDGSPYEISKYPDLYDAIGDSWNGTNQVESGFFHVPDLRGMFLRGLDSGRGKDPDKNRTLGDEQKGMFQEHQHTIAYRSEDEIGEAGNKKSAQVFGFDGDTTHPAETGAIVTPSGQAFKAHFGPETRPVNVAVNFIIKY